MGFIKSSCTFIKITFNYELQRKCKPQTNIHRPERGDGTNQRAPKQTGKSSQKNSHKTHSQTNKQYKLFSPYWFQTYSDNIQLKACTLKSISLALSRTGIKAEPVVQAGILCRCLTLYTDNSTFRIPTQSHTNFNTVLCCQKYTNLIQHCQTITLMYSN